MEKYAMFSGCMFQYCEDVDSPQIFLQIQIPMGSLCGTQKVILKFKWKDKKPMTKILLRKKMEFG